MVAFSQNGTTGKPITKLMLTPDDVVSWSPFDAVTQLYLRIFGIRALTSEAVATLCTAAAVSGKEDGIYEVRSTSADGTVSVVITIESKITGTHFSEEMTKEISEAEPAEERAARKVGQTEDLSKASPLGKAVYILEKFFATVADKLNLVS